MIAASLFSFICAWMSKEGILCKSAWVLLGLLLGAQGVYQWLAMQQVVGDEDALVLLLCVAASLVVYVLIRLEYLRDETKNILLVGLAGQALAAITDASDGGLYVLNGLTSSSFSWIADLFDLIWTPPAWSQKRLVMLPGNRACRRSPKAPARKRA